NDPLSLQVRHASADIFPILGVKPVLGRVYTRAEDVEGAPRMAVISYELWQQRFGGRPGAAGETFHLGGVDYALVGVMPKDFRFFAPVQLWVPTRFGAADHNWPGRFLRVVARLNAGVPV